MDTEPAVRGDGSGNERLGFFELTALEQHLGEKAGSIGLKAWCSMERRTVERRQILLGREKLAPLAAEASSEQLKRSETEEVALFLHRGDQRGIGLLRLVHLSCKSECEEGVHDVEPLVRFLERAGSERSLGKLDGASSRVTAACLDDRPRRQEHARSDAGNQLPLVDRVQALGGDRVQGRIERRPDDQPAFEPPMQVRIELTGTVAHRTQDVIRIAVAAEEVDRAFVGKCDLGTPSCHFQVFDRSAQVLQRVGRICVELGLAELVEHIEPLGRRRRLVKRTTQVRDGRLGRSARDRPLGRRAECRHDEGVVAGDRLSEV